MNSGNLFPATILLLSLATKSAFAQPAHPAVIYSLLSGSELTEECLICDIPPITVPLTGSFVLHFAYQTPIFTRYQLQQISFHGGTPTSRQYDVVGEGTYQIGGEVAVTQDMFLDINIDNGSKVTRALCINTNPTVNAAWPEIQITVNQTNGTPGQVYYLTLVAVPPLQFVAITPDRTTGNVRLDWERYSGMAQLERATNVTGPYSPLSPVTTDSSFTDLGALTNRTQSFYRLRQY